jgi:heptosyltransferase-2
MKIRNNCLYFKGDIPCKFHKSKGVHCDNCEYFVPIYKRILIIKLGAAGDVIRTTPILHKLKKEFSNSFITWLTDYPVFIPKNFVDKIITWNEKTIISLQASKFDLLINLDKDEHAIALAELIDANVKKGYLKDEFFHCKPADKDAENKWLTGLFDDLNKANNKSYPQEVFEILGYEFSGEKYILNVPKEKLSFDLPKNKKIVGLNTGCGDRWLTRLWGNENWIKLAFMLDEAGYFPILLGGKYENDINTEIAIQSPAKYFGYFSLDKFINLVNATDLVVTSVTMAMHVTIALEKKIVLLNNIFNKNEFELYGLGEILQPDKECLGCYRNFCEKKCMETISPEIVFEKILKLLAK